MFKSITGLVSITLLQGCAYLTTYQAGMGTPTTGVSMDAKQRVVLVNTVGAQRRMCAEPSPDALSALGASLAASSLTEAGAAKQISGALGESAASIGLRTTSIQLMRDSMFRACEAYLSDGISKSDYAELQAHFQTLTVGLLAIEQLTGAVQAQQVALISEAGAGAVPDTVAEAERLVDAKKKTLAQKQSLDEAIEKKSKASKDVTEKETSIAAAKVDASAKADRLVKVRAELDELKKKAAAAPPDGKPDADKAVTAKEAEVNTAKADSDSAEKKTAALQGDLVELQKAVVAIDKEVQSEEARLGIEKQAEAFAEQAFRLATTRVRSTVRGDAKFGQQTRGSMSDATVTAVAGTIKEIVDTVVGTSIESQRCIKLLATELKGVDADQRKALFTVCDAVAKEVETKSRIMLLKAGQPK